VGCLDLTGGDAGNRAKLDEINGKSKDEAEGVEQNRQADLGIGMRFTKLIEGQNPGGKRYPVSDV
jgi:hypothetical protein